MESIELETRRVDGSGMVRFVVENTESAALWAQHNTQTFLLVASALLATLVILRLLIRGGFRRSTRL